MTAEECGAVEGRLRIAHPVVGRRMRASPSARPPNAVELEPGHGGDEEVVARELEADRARRQVADAS